MNQWRTTVRHSSWGNPDSYTTIINPKGETVAALINHKDAEALVKELNDTLLINETIHAELRQIVPERDRLYDLLTNLLARVHRDGGQYTEEHGIDKSVEVADLIVATLIARVEAANQ